MTDIIQELEETKEILESLAEILGCLDDVPEGCKRLALLAAHKVVIIENEYSFPGVFPKVETA